MATKIKIKQSSVSGNLPSGVSTDPAYIEQGELAINTADQILYSKDSSGTIFAVTSGGSSSVEISDAVPTSPSAGDLWIDSASMSLNAYYADGTSSQWVGISGSGGGGSGGGFNGAMNTHMIPTADDTYDIGSASYKVRDLYLGDNSLHIGGINISATSYTNYNKVILDGGIQYSGHILPDANDTYDIGSAEYKIRDLFVSDNSLWIGDDHKVSVEGGKQKNKKRKKGKTPKKVFDALIGDAPKPFPTEADLKAKFKIDIHDPAPDPTVDPEHVDFQPLTHQWLHFAIINGMAGAITPENIFDDTDDFEEEAVGGLTDLSDVDLTTTAPEADQVLKYDGINWIPGVGGGSGGTTNLTAGVIWDNHATTAYDYTNDDSDTLSSGTTATDITVVADKTAVLTHTSDSEELRSVYIEKFVEEAAVPGSGTSYRYIKLTFIKASAYVSVEKIEAFAPNSSTTLMTDSSAVTASGSTWGYTPERALNPANSITSDAGWAHSSSSPAWWQYDFGTPTLIDSIRTHGYPNVSSALSQITLEGSMDGTTFTVLDTVNFNPPEYAMVTDLTMPPVIPETPGVTYWQLESFDDWGVQFTDSTTTTITNNTGADATARFRITAPTAAASGSGGGATTLAELTDSTTATTDPLITSNLAVGHFWINSTSGEAFVCTDATTDANVWTNIGEGIDNIFPFTAASGGTLTQSGSWYIHTFTSSGTLTNSTDDRAFEYLVVAGGGGGGGGYGGGGGAGGMLTGTFSASGNLTITVGGGGAAGSMSGVASGVDGSDSVISGAGVTTVTSIGGGGGGGNQSPYQAGRDGGSGGGAIDAYAGGSGTTGQGYAGGLGNIGGYYGMGGGGGKTTVGEDGSGSKGGDGGTGGASSITGASVTYAGGGAGGTGATGGANGSGGSGGGGSANASGNADNGTANTGGGGAAASNSYGAGNGGSGVVIVRYSS